MKISVAVPRLQPADRSQRERRDHRPEQHALNQWPDSYGAQRRAGKAGADLVGHEPSAVEAAFARILAAESGEA